LELSRLELPHVVKPHAGFSDAFPLEFGTSRASNSAEAHRMRRKMLGEILQEGGKISAAELHQVFDEQKGKMVRPGESNSMHGSAHHDREGVLS
jgi:hypothetical protein